MFALLRPFCYNGKVHSLKGENSLELVAITNEKDAQMMDPLQLAYIGDTVWDLLIRTQIITTGYNVHKLHVEATAKVNAGAQALALQKVIDHLTPKEADIVRRGRNAKAKHSAPKNQNPADYQYSTGFEALLGFLYLTGQGQRLKEIFSYTNIKEA